MMFRNHLKIAFRNLLKRKAYSTINIIGLTVGIASTLLIFLVIRYETTYENFNSRKDRIYRVVGTMPTEAMAK
jgi:putative ABC transport system permease protein